MTVNKEELSSQYLSAMECYLAGGGETALAAAYEIGRRALNEGMGVLEMGALHHAALKRILPRWESTKGAAKKASAMERFFVESLTPFEMTHRGFREANEALRVSEQRYRELFENANDVVFTTDLEGNFTSINKAGERLSGYLRDEAPAMNFVDVVPPEYRDLARRMLGLKIETGTPTTFQLEIVTKGGRRIPLEISTGLILHKRKPVGVQGIARDISERKRAQQAMRQLNEALEEQAKRIAHALHDEAGQLLATVHIALEEVSRESASVDRGRFEKIREFLYDVEDQLRQFSHELRPTVLDDLGLLAALEIIAKNVSKRTGISVMVENSLKGRLPVLVETALYRITQEALTNISRHSKAKTAILTLSAKGRKLVYSIRDDGVGFDANSELAKRGERGLGLLGIQTRLDAFGGSFSIHSAPNKGSEIVITIPLEG